MARWTSDTKLMARFMQGDARAFETLYERHRGPLYRYFLRQGIDHETAAELTQEVWLKVIRAKERYAPTAKFTTYIFTLAHHCLVDRFRRATTKLMHKSAGAEFDLSTLQADPASNPEQVALRDEAAEQFRQALAELPDAQREAFILKQEAGLSLADVAEITGVSAETAKSRLRYAFVKLRRRLAANGNRE